MFGSATLTTLRPVKLFLFRYRLPRFSSTQGSRHSLPLMNSPFENAHLVSPEISLNTCTVDPHLDLTALLSSPATCFHFEAYSFYAVHMQSIRAEHLGGLNRALVAGALDRFQNLQRMKYLLPPMALENWYYNVWTNYSLTW